MRFVLRLFAASFVVSFVSACSSSDFVVAGDDSATTGDTSSTDDGQQSDGSTDSAPHPCDPEPGVAKFCIDVDLLDKAHPPYGTPNATKLGIDGKGRVWAQIFDKDPGLRKPGDPWPTPVTMLQYPPADKLDVEADIDKEVPVTLAGRAAPGEYWVVAGFQDTKGPLDVRHGDFIAVPSVTSEGRPVFTKLSLAASKTERQSLKLSPLRRVEVDVGISVELHVAVKGNANVHGDGPIAFAIYDGVLGSKESKVLAYEVLPCRNLNVHSPTPPRLNLAFGTVVTGPHRLYGALYDYSAGKEGSSSDPPPGRGTFLLPLDPKIAKVPDIDIQKGEWIAKVGTDFEYVNFPYKSWETPPLDPYECK